MSEEKDRYLFVVGKRDMGILFVRTNPLRVTLISAADIESYHGSTGRDAFAEAGGMAAVLAADQDKTSPSSLDSIAVEGVKELIRNNYHVGNVDLSFAVQMKDDGDQDYQRFGVNPLWNVVSNLKTDGPDPGEDVSFSSLQDFVDNAG